MSHVRLDCQCGKSYQLKRDVPAGKSIRCPACGHGMRVPAAAAMAAAVPAMAAVPAGHYPSQEDEFEAAMAAAAAEPAYPPAAAAPEPYREAPPPPPKAVRQTAYPKPVGLSYSAPAAAPQRQPRVVFEEGWFGSINSGMIGGVLMMVIAVVWFVLGLMADRIFFYPPILFVIGLVAIFKGMFGGGD